jgi:predicted nucleic-acid-binding Zn-ribbon protein
MPPTTTCPKCGAADLIANLPVFGGGSTEPPLHVDLRQPEPKPRPMIWQQDKQRAFFHATVCGACGYAELYATEPAKLLAAYRKGYK